MEKQSNQTTQRQPSRAVACSQLGKRIGDTSDLPDSLQKELRLEPRWHKEFLNSLRELEGSATRSEIMVTVYRQTGKVMKRGAFYRAAKTLRFLDIILKNGSIYQLSENVESKPPLTTLNNH